MRKVLAAAGLLVLLPVNVDAFSSFKGRFNAAQAGMDFVVMNSSCNVEWGESGPTWPRMGRSTENPGQSFQQWTRDLSTIQRGGWTGVTRGPGVSMSCPDGYEPFMAKLLPGCSYRVSTSNMDSTVTGHYIELWCAK